MAAGKSADEKLQTLKTVDNYNRGEEMKRIIVGLSGASGMPIAVRLLKVLKAADDVEVHLVITKSAGETIEYETGLSVDQVKALADVNYELDDVGAAISSGSFKTEGMIICPAAMKTVAGIASGFSDNLLLRAADVVLKERRKLVVVARETPLSSIHLRNLLTLSEAGAVILPPMQTYYNKPESVEDMINHTVGRILDRFDIETPDYRRWS